MYMFPMSSDIYAAVPSRVWWAPWRWTLDVYRWERDPFAISAARTIATNISKAECIGLMKTLGYEEEIK
jgi:hypothetical protein